MIAHDIDRVRVRSARSKEKKDENGDVLEEECRKASDVLLGSLILRVVSISVIRLDGKKAGQLQAR